MDQTALELVADRDVQLAAVNNSPENFRLVFPELFQKRLLGRMGRNEKLVYAYLDNEEMAADVLRAYLPTVLAGARVAYQQHCPIGELLALGEGATIEYKSTLRTGVETGEMLKALETACVKTVAAFANSRDGGTLLIGVADDGGVHGLASDYASLHQDGKDDRDRFLLHLGQMLINAVGETVASTVSVQMHTVDGAELCRVHVPPSSFPVDATVVVDKGGQLSKRTAFYVRIGNGTREISDFAERGRYLASRFSSGRAA